MVLGPRIICFFFLAAVSSAEYVCEIAGQCDGPAGDDSLLHRRGRLGSLQEQQEEAAKKSWKAFGDVADERSNKAEPTPQPPTPKLEPTLDKCVGDCAYCTPHDEIDDGNVHNDMPLCANGEYKWACESGGRGPRVQCPSVAPIMCAYKKCDKNMDYCCETDCGTAGSEPFGGPRLCEAMRKDDWPSFNNVTYFAKTREAKGDQIMTEVLKDSTLAKWLSNQQSVMGLLTESMEPSMHQVGDEMPKQGLGHRQKFIHSEGAVAGVKLVQSGEHPFTGVFAGADTGVVRMSTTIKPHPKNTPLSPGIGLKFLRDGIDSANLVAMFDVAGQPSWNFFANNISNQIPPPPASLLVAKFATATSFVQCVGLSDWATHGQDGQAVEQPVFPFKLRFEPSGEFTFPDDYSPDRHYVDELKTIGKDHTLYKVYGLSAPSELGGQEYYIGDLVTTSAVVSSNWGDKHLFYRHQRCEEDIQMMPEWTDYYPNVENSYKNVLNQLKNQLNSLFHK